MKLISNSRHNNEIYIYFSKRENCFIKSTYNIISLNSLKREFYGYRWYSERIDEYGDSKNKLIINSDENYGKLYLLKIDCVPGNPYEYIKVWPSQHSELVNLHGDFSVGNIIYNPAKAYIIDWEHFHYNIAPWGIDLLNLVYEAVFFSMDKNTFLNNEDKKTFIHFYKIILNHFSALDKTNCNIDFLLTFLEKNKKLWGRSFSKLPVLKFSKRQLNYIKSIEANLR